MPNPNELLHERMAQKRLVYVDSGTGTELERRGADMHGDVWCAAATGTSPELLQAIHRDNILAGADIITANTFSSNRNMLEPGGLGDKVEELNRAAVKLALAARDEVGADRPVIVAGSMSHQVPVLKGKDVRNPDTVPTGEQARANFEELAGILADAGADMILMEMMSDPDLAIPAIESALATGLPVWVGFSARRDANGQVVSSSRRELPFTELVSAVLPVCNDVAAMGVMHTTLEISPDAIEQLQAQWSGPTMVYPDVGHFKMPNWVFDPSVTPEAVGAVMRDWQERFGVNIVGGCCGMGPEYIQGMVAAG